MNVVTSTNEFESGVEKFLVSNPTTHSANVSPNAMSCPNGLDSSALAVLRHVHSIPQAYNFPPDVVRKNRVNPFEHAPVSDVTRHDVNIELEERVLKARLYRPSDNQFSHSPILIYFHGGGFVLGDIESHDKMLAQLCSQSDIAIISVEYRLAPEIVFPGAVEDVQKSVEWVFTHSQKLGVDANRIAIGGDSAGANLAAVYCSLNQNNDEYMPKLQVLIYPSIIGNDSSESRARFAENLLLSKELLKWFHDHYIDESNQDDPRFNILNCRDFSRVPPAFVITGGFDPLRDEGQMYVNALKNSGVTTKHSCYTDMFHGFINFGTLEQSRSAVRECANVLKGALFPLQQNEI